MKHGEERVMEVVTPLRVNAVTARLSRANDTRVVEIAFSNEDEPASQGGGEHIDLGRELLEEMDCGAINKLVDSVEAQAVDVEVAHPHDCVITKEAADLIAAPGFEVDGIAPRRVVQVGEVRSKFAGVVADRPKVVVDDVVNDGDSAHVAGVDEALEAVGAAVVLCDC